MPGKATGEPKADFGGPMFAMLEADKSRTDKAKNAKLALPEPQSKGAQAHQCVNSLRTQVQKVDEAYDKCQAVWVKGQKPGRTIRSFAKRIGEGVQSSKDAVLPFPWTKTPDPRKVAEQASCRSAIDAARNVVADVGVSSASHSGGLRELARSKDSNSERDCRQIMVKKFGLALPVKRSVLQTEDPSFKIPILKMEDWADFMLQNNCWHVLCGLVRPDPERERAILASFWSKFRTLSPDHDVFKLESAGRLELNNTAPVLLHGDEGRGRKHSAYLVVSFRGLLGRGIHTGERQKCQRGVKKPYLKQLCNYRGHSYTSRFMIAGLRKCDYTGDNAHVFSALMSSCAQQAESVATTGIRDLEGNKRWMVMLHITGDWPWLHKSGQFKRSFHNAQKKKGQRVFQGICHECRAGQDDIPFEQIATKRPLWVNTFFEEDPFTQPSPFLVVPHITGKLPSLWTWDFFHTWHLGIAKRFVGSTLALLSTDHRNGTCNPCVFFNSAMGCLHGRACAYCHQLEHPKLPSSGHHRPLKVTRDRIKARIQACLQGPPDKVHASLQAEAHKHPYARSMIQLYLDEALDAAGRVLRVS
eukprot:s1972_g1.t1